MSHSLDCLYRLSAENPAPENTRDTWLTNNLIIKTVQLILLL